MPDPIVGTDTHERPQSAGPQSAGPPSAGPQSAGLVIAAGELPLAWVTDSVVRRRLGQGAFVVAADGGLVHAKALGIEPDLIVGDFDSVPAGLLATYPSHLVERHEVEKDELDLELALTAALNAGARELSVLGAFGDRFDQSLAAVLIAARLTSEGQSVDLHGGTHSAWVLAGGATHALDVPVGTTVSVIALVGDAVVSGKGLAYRLDDLHVPFGTGLGVSNLVTHAGGSITCVRGVIAVVVEY